MSAESIESPFYLNLLGVANPTGAPPVATLLWQTNGGVYRTEDGVPLSATATAGSTNYPLTRLDVVAVAGARQLLLARATNSAVTISLTNIWLGPDTGSYSVFARAKDNGERVGYSAAADVQVLAASGNHAPQAVNDTFTVLANSRNNVLPVLANDSDPDGDLLKIVSLPDAPHWGTAAIMGGGTAIRYTPNYFIRGSDALSYVVSDGRGGTCRAIVSIIIDASDIPWVTISSPASGYSINAGSALALTAYVTNWANVVKVEFFEGLRKLGETNGGNSGYYTLPWTALHDDCGCLFTARATDKFGQVGTAPGIVINVGNPSLDYYPPSARISDYSGSSANVPFSETNTTLIRDGAFDLSGRAYHPQGSNVVWELGLYHPDGTLVRNLTPTVRTNPVGPNSPTNLLVHCDLSTLANDIYDLRLDVTAAYNVTHSIRRFALDSQLKIGPFSFSQQDLVIPVSGLPLMMVRTYDSLRANSPLPSVGRGAGGEGGLGDFGPGWTWALNSMDVALDEDRTDTEDLTDPDSAIFSKRSGGGRDVTLTLPDGRRTTFSFYLDGPTTCFAGDPTRSCYFGRWKAAPGVTATLEAQGDNTLNGIVPNHPYWQATGALVPMDDYDFPGFVLKTLDGTRYIISRQDLGEHDVDNGTNGLPYTVQAYGRPYLSQILQPNGDTITISSNSIVHTHGTNTTRRVTFQRNDDGLITSVSDPVSQLQASNSLPAVLYGYDSYQNLVSVARLVDRASGRYATNSFEYTNALYPHFITRIIDPRGVALAHNEYDDQGRLTALVDANGRRTEIDHTSTNKLERVINRLGQTNIYVYDLRGNVTATTNALGQVTRMGYDGLDHQMATTNAFGTAYATWSTNGFDTNGNMLVSVDALHTNWFSYSSNGLLLSQTNSLGQVTTNGYDSAGNLLITVQLNDQGVPVTQSSSAYDSNGRLIETRNGTNLMASFGYDTYANLTSSTDANGFARSFAYDDNGNQTNSSYTWVGSGVTNIVRTSTEYDAQGRVVRAVDAETNATLTVYNDLGKVDYSVDKLGNTNSFLYDARGNVIQTVGPEALAVRTVYDLDGKPILTTDRNQVTGTRTDYDAAGRVTNMVRLMNVQVSLDADTNNPGQYSSSVASWGTPFSTNSTVYDPNGRVLSRKGPDGRITTYDYYTDGQLRSVTGPLTNTTYYQYDAAGRQSAVGDALTHTNRFEYDPVGRAIRAIFADSTYTSNKFNDVGQRIAQSDQAGLTISYGYTPSGELTNVTMPQVLDPEAGNSPTSAAWTYLYDPYGRQFAMIDAKGRATTNTFDALGRQVNRRLPMGETETNIFNSKGQLWKHIDFKGQTNEFVYDKLGRVKAKFYFAHGANYPSNAVCYLYNPLGQLWKIIERTGADATTSACDGYAALVGPIRGPPTGLIPALARTSAEVWGRLTGLALIALGLLLVPREKLWQLRGLKGAGFGTGANRGNGGFAGVIVRILLSPFSPLPPVQLPRPFHLRLPSVFWRFATYILLTALIGNDPIFERLWTANAQCNTPPNLSTETTRITEFYYSFDGQLVQVNSPEGVINYDYELATGRHISTCTGNSYVEYGYDELGRLKTVTALRRNGSILPAPEVTVYTYDAVGSRASVALPNGVVTTYQYDTLNRLTNLTHKAGGTSLLASYAYQLHPTGRRTNAVEILKQEDGSFLTNTLTWFYDGMYRLTNEVSISSASGSSGTYTNNYQYDKVGNRFAKVHYQNGTTTTITNLFNDDDQLLKEVTKVGSSVTETNLYAYDANGSLIAKTNTSSGSTAAALYGYDLKNKLSSLAANGSTTTYLYNDQGIRVRSTSGGSATYYLIDANNHTGYQQILEELGTPGTKPTRSYVIGDDVLAQGSAFTAQGSYFLYDGHGSTRQLSSSGGSVTSQYNYDAYGLTLSTSSGTPETSLLYCGEQGDSALGMYNLRARFYDPANGRFDARDTVLESNFDPQSLNKYTYANCDSVNALDPSGQFTLGEMLVVIGIILNVAGLFYHVNSARNKYASGQYQAAAVDEAWAMVDFAMLVIPGSGLIGSGMQLAAKGAEAASTGASLFRAGIPASAVWGYITTLFSVAAGSGGGGPEAG